MTESTERRAVVRCVFCQTPNRVDLTKLSLGPKCANCHRPILLDRRHHRRADALDPIPQFLLPFVHAVPHSSWRREIP